MEGPLYSSCVAVLMNTSNSAIPSASKSAASLTILTFMVLCSSLLCFLMPFSYAFDTFAHILATVSMHVASSVLACKWVGLLQSRDIYFAINFGGQEKCALVRPYSGNYFLCMIIVYCAYRRCIRSVLVPVHAG